jgi:hypothetical protein
MVFCIAAFEDELKSNSYDDNSYPYCKYRLLYLPSSQSRLLLFSYIIFQRLYVFAGYILVTARKVGVTCRQAIMFNPEL